jgi:hypothetical protein
MDEFMLTSRDSTAPTAPPSSFRSTNDMFEDRSCWFATCAPRSFRSTNDTFVIPSSGARRATRIEGSCADHPVPRYVPLRGTTRDDGLFSNAICYQ